MSYDLHLFRPVPGEDPLEAAQRCQPYEFEKTPINPAKEELKTKLAQALITHHPKLKIFPLDHAAIAEHLKISKDEAMQRVRYIELDPPTEDPIGVQITIHDDSIAISVPFWHKEPRATEAFEQLRAYIQVATQTEPFLTFDPQLERIITIEELFTKSLPEYVGAVNSLHSPSHLAKIAKLAFKQWRQD